MRLSRERTETLFRLHAKEQGLGISDLERLGDFAYRVTLDGETLNALVLSRSWDYWEYRLSFAAPTVSLVICSQHDSCLPVRVLEVGSSGYCYAARDLPRDAAPPGAKRTCKTARVFVGALLSGDQQAFNALAQMHSSSQKRYRRRMEHLLTEKRVGNQLFISPELQSA
jgi:hypothetical protein